MKIKIESIRIKNFMGIRDLEINFSERTNIYGRNATGKSTVQSAFTWLLFGKDSQDRKDFSIKTLDQFGNPLHKLTHEVEAVISEDGINSRLRRALKEKWTKRRGSAEEEFTGHETEYFWNDVPVSQKDYQEKVSAIIPEQTFKLLTNVEYFNSIDWKTRRSMLFDLAGVITDLDVAAGNQDFIKMLESIKQGITIEQHLKEIQSKKKLLKSEIETIPARIDELKRSLPEAVNVSDVNQKISELSAQIIVIDGQISSKTKAWEESNNNVLAVKKTISGMKTKLDDLIQKEKSEQLSVQHKNELRKQQLKNDIDLKKNTLKNLTRSIEEKSIELTKKISERQELVDKWETENSRTVKFYDDDFNCPFCKRPFEAGDIEARKLELTSSFNQEKANNLKSITDKGKQAKTLIDCLTKEIDDIKNSTPAIEIIIENLQKELESLENIQKIEYSPSNTVKELSDEIIKMEQSIETIPPVNTTELQQKKTEITKLIDQEKSKLTIGEVIEKTNARIKELENSQRTISQQIADIECIEFTIEKFTKAKIAMVESRINGKFKHVAFKMYEQQINGGEAETCITLINGVPYSDANNAGRINAGIDIINTFSEHTGVVAPIWVDNKEAVNELIPTNSQLISLIVSENDVILRVE